jgi:hypothetical protein
MKALTTKDDSAKDTPALMQPRDVRGALSLYFPILPVLPTVPTLPILSRFQAAGWQGPLPPPTRVPPARLQPAHAGRSGRVAGGEPWAPRGAALRGGRGGAAGVGAPGKCGWE